MKKILLVCAAGMSTSLLVTKMETAAQEKGLEAEIFALSVTESKDVINTVDLILLGPQVRFQKAAIEKQVDGRVPVEVVDMRAYGTMNGEAVIEQAMKLLNV